LYLDDNGHGTHVAGIAAAKDNSSGVVGVAPGARLWAVKVLDETGHGSLSCMIAGVDGVPTTYLSDRECCLPQMVDDGTNAYLHAGGVVAQIDGAGVPTYELEDGLGSVRGLTDSDGTLAGMADYDVFGEARGMSGASSVFGFTGEQFDSETGFTFLRARYLHRRLGRFLSEDGPGAGELRREQRLRLHRRTVRQ